jgi:DNA-binding GntR family transcriptional regulator
VRSAKGAANVADEVNAATIIAMVKVLEDEGVEMPEKSNHGRWAYAVLRAGIIRRLLPPGTPLAEADLAEALGVSRTPIRSAVQSLLEEGLLETGAKRQVSVRRLDASERREIMLLREALERVAVVEAAATLDDDEIDELRLLLLKQRRAASEPDIERFMDLDDQFHLAIARGARFPLLVRFLGQIRARVRLTGVHALGQSDRLDAVLDEHEAIIAALDAHDGERSQEALTRHLRATHDLLERLDASAP